MLAKREELLSVLNQLRGGIDPKSIIEQSDCFVFQDGRVMAYDGEVMCHSPSPLKKEITGAVPAEVLLNLLGKMTEDEIDVSQSESELLIRGKRRRGGITRQKEVVLPVDGVEKPTKWKPLHEDFCTAISLVSKCASTDQSRFALICVHVHPNWVEATDDFQACRWKIDTPVSSPALVKRTSVQNMSSLAVTEVAETDKWIHFRNTDGLVYSCRRWVEDFPPLTEVLKVDGHPLTLPKALDEAIGRAEVIIGESVGGKQLNVSIGGGKMKVTGKGPLGWFTETKKIHYDGPDTKFMIPVAVLTDLSKRHTDCVVGADKIRAKGGKYVYISCLGIEEPVSAGGEE